jgi:hypothetical protein
MAAQFKGKARRAQRSMMKCKIHKLKTPTVAELVSVVAEYNRAWELEYRSTGGQIPPAGKNPFMDHLFAAATVAAAELKPALTVQSPKPKAPGPKF